ncbi:MAG TPA: ORC1-type DNA replication protein [Methanoregulaceae archaeon]|nr:ORC1-type DNA replication protein [Methanoregulaceae archaeon]HPD74678.1 ORC1-type DNA replication protein [Methanoregulaceae archaeon]HRY75164.1 ORC1-type DNA replication protein [Methanoregulaceae archaeon]
MAKNLLMWDETLFRDPEVFEFDFVPEQFQFRETQMRELAFQIRPGLKGSTPLNTICKGLPGTGKTTSVKKLFSEITDTTKKLVPVLINCQIDNTKFAIFAQIYRKLTGHLPPASGTSFKQLFDAIARILQKEGIVLLVALDDANYLLYENEINKVLYTLLRAHESYEKVRIGVIVIVSDLDVDFNKAVDARVLSVFRPTEIYFPPYADTEIREIVQARIQQGLYPGVLSEEMLALVIDQTVKSGDLRVGIDLIKRATLHAEKEARRSIGRDDICAAYEVSKYLHLSFTVRTLKDEEKRVLAALARAGGSGQEMNAGEVYKTISESVTIGYTRFYEIVKKLDALRLVNLHYRQGRGRTRLISLRYDPAKILEYLS